MVVRSSGFIPLSRMPAEEIERAWAAAQRRLAQLSSDSRLLITKENWDTIMFERPDAVVDVISEVVESARMGLPLKA